MYFWNQFKKVVWQVEESRGTLLFYKKSKKSEKVWKKKFQLFLTHVPRTRMYFPQVHTASRLGNTKATVLFIGSLVFFTPAIMNSEKYVYRFLPNDIMKWPSHRLIFVSAYSKSISRLFSQSSNYFTDYSSHSTLLVPTVQVPTSGKCIVHRRKGLWVEDSRLGGEQSPADLFWND